jgi:ribosomal protein L32
MARVPGHWQKFGGRISPLTGSPRLAVNPPNAILNYLYAVLESESRLALAALGLDPGIGVLHNDLRSRDSLACDLMEPIRPQCDAYLLDWLARAPLKREWFFEQRDGNCRLMASLATKLSESASIWRRAVAPFAEGIARALWLETPKSRRLESLSTPLTQSRKRKSRSSFSNEPQKLKIAQSNVCGICGNSIKAAHKYCRVCATTIRRENVRKASILGRLATLNRRAQAKRARTQRMQMAARKAWKPSEQPAWLTGKFYSEVIQPRLLHIQVRTIQSTLLVSEPYALRIRDGLCMPHPRHWVPLARISGSIGD